MNRIVVRRDVHHMAHRALKAVLGLRVLRLRDQPHDPPAIWADGDIHVSSTHEGNRSSAGCALDMPPSWRNRRFSFVAFSFVDSRLIGENKPILGKPLQVIPVRGCRRAHQSQTLLRALLALFRGHDRLHSHSPIHFGTSSNARRLGTARSREN
jgi:hypothetical protein